MIAFNDCNIIKRTIVQQINTALDNDFLSDLIDNSTGLLVRTIPEIMAELYNMYDTVTPQSLTAAKSKLQTTNYSVLWIFIHNPVADSVFLYIIL